MKGAKSKSESKKPDSRLSVKKKAAAPAKKAPPAKKAKEAKDPNKPKRPASAFFVFMEDFRKQYKEKHPNNKSVSVVGKAGGDKWKSLSTAEKAPYVAKAEKRKSDYDVTLKAYNKKLSEAKDAEEDEEEESDKSKSEVHDDEEDEDDDSGEIYLYCPISSPSSTAIAAASSPSRSPAAASPSRSPNATAEVAGAIAAATDGGGGSPCFSVRFYGPRCPQRKKLMAARSMFFLRPSPKPNISTSPVDGPEPVIDAFTNDFLLAH